MSIGYACLTIGVPDTDFRTCTRKYATPDKLRELIAHNLQVLDRILDYNISQNIELFRISSDIIPFGSSPVNTIDWASEFDDTLAAIGQKAQRAGMRLSMHPGQYTVLNSPDPDVVSRAVTDLEYHARFLDALGLDASHKLILHIGGVYGDKPTAMKRFCAQYRRLSMAIQKRLVIENDDKLYTIQDVLTIGEAEQIPVVFDNLHHQINPPAVTATEASWITRCRSTWKPQDGRQKTHYSQQAPDKKPGSHSETIRIREFLAYYTRVAPPDIDIMLEVKDKNLSAVKAGLCTRCNGHIKDLETEWARYKYAVLEHSPACYQQIRELLKDKSGYPAVAFYDLLEDALKTPASDGTMINAARHVWGYFKNDCTAKEKEQFENNVKRFSEHALPFSRIRSQLRRLTIKYHADYLLQSYYFIL